jgi:membrane-associated phospholipid phosphatase
MSTTVAVLITGLAAAAVVLGLGMARRTSSATGGIDAEAAEHWIVRAAARRPRWRRVLVQADRRVAGGASIALSSVLVLGAALAVGWLLDSVDRGTGFARWDEAVAVWGPDHADTLTADVLRWVTELGTTPWVVLALVVVGLLDWRRRRTAVGLGFLLVVGLGVSLVNNGLKHLVMRERPPVDHLVDSSGSSFPSGHSATAAACWLAVALVVGLWTRRNRRLLLVAVAVGIASLVAARRALLGVHWLTDVLAGVVVGWTWTLLVAIAFGGRIRRLGAPVEDLVADGSAPPDERRARAVRRPHDEVPARSRVDHEEVIQ